ncbi:MAG: HIT domain-containing protein [Chloroflexi bacterium]|nr:HIT domain-containing protein [Chloroflexota bacterium]
MKKLWAPWRVEYLKCEQPAGCILCRKPEENRDSQNYILFRGKMNFVILNIYPYNTAHLMVAPFRHLASLDDLNDKEMFEHFDLVRRSARAIKEAYHPEGFNIGMNLGRVAGAGVEGHIHTHIVPRWKGDTNFMPVLSDTKVLPEALAATYAQLKDKIR